MLWLNVLAALMWLRLARARDAAPIALRPSEWLGIDGNWSTVQIYLGSHAQPVNVLVSTALSEFWVVGPGGCLQDGPQCVEARGGIFQPSLTSNWSPLGIWQLGLSYLGQGGNGNYGLATIARGSATNDPSFAMSDVLTATINTTDYFLGLFGLNVVQGRFGSKVEYSPLTQAVEKFGWIPSYSYGYTAGASYENTPASVTLGGYDGARCTSQDVDFTLGQSDNMPRPLVRAVEVVAGNSSKPSGWPAPTQLLSSWDTSFTAILDSSTPFLWLPDSVCDAFAAALSLTYNSTFDLYTIDNEQYNRFLQPDSFTFNFVFSSLDNTDDFGYPLDVPGVVNISISSRAFVGALRYPFMNGAIPYGDPAVPYFSLRRAGNESLFILGRSFLQESYLITEYDRAKYSIHQALFSDQADILPIERPATSPYPPPANTNGAHHLTRAEMAGTAVSAIAGSLVVLLVGLLFWRRSRLRNKKRPASVEENKGSTSSVSMHSGQRPLSSLWSIVARKKRSQATPSVGPDKAEKGEQHAEVPDHQIYELPAPPAPAELDGSNDVDPVLDGGELNCADSATITQQAAQYERARRRMERQLRGPVPAYTPPADDAMPPPDKTTHAEQPSPMSPPRSAATESNGGSLPYALPSPVTPRDGSSRSDDFPSGMTAADLALLRSSGLTRSCSGPSGQPESPAGSRSTARPELTRSNSHGSASPVILLGRRPLPPSAVRLQRRPIDPSNVICLGRLHGRNSSLGGPVLPTGGAQVQPAYPSSVDSLGSNYTEEEERIIQEMMKFVDNQGRAETLTGPPPPPPSPPSPPAQDAEAQHHHHEARADARPAPSLAVPRNRPEPRDDDDPPGPGTIDPGAELIHVPQMAPQRYSWEEEEEGEEAEEEER